MKFKYDWSCNPEVYELLVKLYNGSLQKLVEYNYIENYASDFIEDTEDFLYGMKQLFPNYFYKVVDKLGELKGISFVSMKEEIEKFVQKRDGYILIDPITVVDYILCINPSNRKKMSVFQGLASTILEFKSDKTLEFTDEYSWIVAHKQAQFEDLNNSKQYINSGWNLLEEALSQMLAQKVYRFIAEGEIDKIQSDEFDEKNKAVIDTAQWDLTNDVLTFSDLMVRFGITISGIPVMYECSEDVIICRLLQKALRGNLAELAIEDYQRKGQELQLCHILYDMGELYQNRTLGHQIKLVNNSYAEAIYNDLLLTLSKLITLGVEEESSSNSLNEDSQIKENRCKVRALVSVNDIPNFNNKMK